MNEQQWVVEALKFYRPLEFFAEYSELSDEQLARELIQQRIKNNQQDYLECFLEAKDEAEKEHEEWELVAPEAIADMVLISQDKNRVWWEDGETEIYPGGEIYTTFLKECSRISRGAFDFSNLEEEWDGEVLGGVLFDWGSDRWRVVPNEMYGWIDFVILDQINTFKPDNPYKFYGHWVGDQTSYLVVLTEEEKQQFESERSWSFYDSFSEDEE